MLALVTTIYASGCASACRHWWAEGHPYPAAAYDTVATVAHQFHDEARSRGWGFELTFMNELSTHPDAVRLIKLTRELGDTADLSTDPYITAPHAPAERDDYPEFLASLRSDGVERFWISLHRSEKIHDWAVRRPGAHAAALSLIRDALERGFRVGANLILTKPALEDWDNLLRDLSRFPGLVVHPTATDFHVSRCAERYEQYRPTVRDVEDIAGDLSTLDLRGTAKWQNPEALREGAYAELAYTRSGFYSAEPLVRITAGDTHISRHTDGTVLAGEGGRSRLVLGNITTDTAEAILDAVPSVGPLLKYYPVEHDRISTIPPVDVLAGKFADRESDAVHTSPMSAYNLWVSRWNAAMMSQ
jgi:hypothetical protein